MPVTSLPLVTPGGSGYILVSLFLFHSPFKEDPMLVLSRHKNEIIQIGSDIQIMIVDIRGDKVRIGINAPDDVTVMRTEVLEANPELRERILNERRTYENPNIRTDTRRSKE